MGEENAMGRMGYWPSLIYYIFEIAFITSLISLALLIREWKITPKMF